MVFAPLFGITVGASWDKIRGEWHYPVFAGIVSVGLLVYFLLGIFLVCCYSVMARMHCAPFSDGFFYLIIFGYPTIMGLAPAIAYKKVFDGIDKLKAFFRAK